MNQLPTGEFYGKQKQKSLLEHIILTDTEYTHSKVDWHYHQSPYFTYLLDGKLFESNKKQSYFLKPGSLLFHNWQDAHYNIKPDEFTRGFHIELDEEWFKNYGINTKNLEGSFSVENPSIKTVMNQIYWESKTKDNFSNPAIQSHLVEIFEKMGKQEFPKEKKPIWVKKLKELIEEECILDFSLTNLALKIEIHPNHLSREFSKHFGTSLGNYIRLKKLNKAFCLIQAKKYSMTEIAYQCGFYDQSHFISSFKKIYNCSPKKLLKQIEGC